MDRRISLVFGAAVLATSPLFLARGRADDGKPRTEFDGQFLAVFHKRIPGDASATATYLAKSDVKKLGDESFLVGTRFEIDGSGAERTEAVIWIALDEVSGIMPFSTTERLKEHFGQRKQH